MQNWQGFDITAAGSGIPAPLGEQIHLLGMLLGHALRKQAGEYIFSLADELILKCREAGDSEAKWREIQADIHNMSLDEIIQLVRTYTIFFHLINEAERQEIIRSDRENSRNRSSETPVRESLEDAFCDLKKRGMTFEQMITLFGHLDIRPTLSSHPTEARRGSILYKQKRISALLSQLRFHNELSLSEQDEIHTYIYRQIALIMVTDERRAEHLSVDDEVRNSLHFCTTSIWETVPRIYCDVQDVFQTYFNERCQLPVFFRYHSWIGGDQAGNSAITPETIRTALQTYRISALKRYQKDLNKLWQEFSISSRRLCVPKELCASLEKEAMSVSLSDNMQTRHRYEPYRLKLSYMMHRINLMISNPANTSYSCDAFLSDLLLLERCIENSGLNDVAACGLLSDLMICVRVFGFHLVSLDIRQHSEVHEKSVHELFCMAGVASNYSQMPEYEKILLLERELLNPRPLISCYTTLSENTASVVKTFQVIREAMNKDRRAADGYVISMTRSVSDVLEVLLLAKETGLWRLRNDKAESLINIVPMFESIEDAEKAGKIMESLFMNPVYAIHLKAQRDFQEIMLGYHECVKDGGYLTAHRTLYSLQETMAKICNAHHIRFRLFHGYGSPVTRGGKKAGDAVFAMSDVSCNGKLRFTEPGEAISFRYGQMPIARRHIEHIIHAVLKTMPESNPTPAPAPETMQLMEQISKYAMQSYRKLIKDPGFSEWHRRLSEGLGNIPWNFAWIQTRYHLPGWYGIGDSLSTFIAEKDQHLSRLQEMYHNCHFFKQIIDNAQKEMAQSAPGIARCYANAGDKRFHQRITEEFEKTKKAVLAITNQKELLEKEPGLSASVRFRKSWTDALNLFQIELLRRWRQAAEDEETSPIRHAIVLTMNGIAAARQSMG